MWGHGCGDMDVGTWMWGAEGGPSQHRTALTLDAERLCQVPSDEGCASSPLVWTLKKMLSFRG